MLQVCLALTWCQYQGKDIVCASSVISVFCSLFCVPVEINNAKQDWRKICEKLTWNDWMTEQCCSRRQIKGNIMVKLHFISLHCVCSGSSIWTPVSCILSDSIRHFICMNVGTADMSPLLLMLWSRPEVSFTASSFHFYATVKLHSQ